MEFPIPVSHADVFVLSRLLRLQWEEAQGCYVLLYPEGMVKLNGSAGEILRRVDGARSVGDIVAELQQSFPGVSDLDRDVFAMLEAAGERGWIERQAGRID
jgi:pyrroloquinoline quinone biosynthesis protein D